VSLLKPIFTGILGSIVGIISSQALIAKNTHPNLVAIINDGQGFVDVGFNGCEEI